MNHPRHPQSLLLPVMRGGLDRMARAGHAPMHALSAAQAKAFYEAGAGVLDIAPHALARVEDHTLRARDGHTIPVRLYAPTLRDAA